VDNRIILIDNDLKYTIQDMDNCLLSENYYYPVYQTTNTFNLIINIVKALSTNNEVVLIDPHFTDEEIKRSGLFELLNIKKAITTIQNPIETVVTNLQNSMSEISIFTSGTTGIPKKIIHNANILLNSVRINEKTINKVWGLTYNLTHMAGLQVIFQALCTESTLVNLYLVNKKEYVFESIEKYGITMLSATPTFYRMLLPTEKKIDTIEQVTLGGEKADRQLVEQIQSVFPKAKVRNIYATTESGSLFASDNDIFHVNSNLYSKVRIVKGMLCIHGDILGKSSDIKLTDGWYITGDIVEIVQENPLAFRIVSRESSIINVGGNKVDPYEIEAVIRTIKGVKEVRVFPRKNSVTGDLVCCEIVKNDSSESLDEIAILTILKPQLAEYKLPRIIKFVDTIEVTRTGKIIRSI
jgi:acyl-coenzyme A synthetase/AMP-(fatty) acid ligase